jgi:hypothetical protein
LNEPSLADKDEELIVEANDEDVENPQTLEVCKMKFIYFLAELN